MKKLNRDELELIFDYCLGVATSEDLEKTRELIASNPEAADFVSKVQEAVRPLDEWTVEPCPEYLVEKTIEHVNEVALGGQEKLGELLAAEGARSTGIRSTVWVNIGRRLAMAAAFMIVGSIVLSTMRYMRHEAWRTQCAAQLAGIAQGISNYSADHQGRMPAVAISAGSPWWKVGDPGKENVSNTRHIWLLIKNGYSNPNDFVCPGAKTSQLEPITAEQAAQLRDFPNRKYISYSLRLIYDQPPSLSAFGRRLIISDMNPLFENLPADFGKPLKVELDDRLLKVNSINHRRKGQNVLFCDGAVKFVKTRRVGANNDDIFTLRGKRFYKGNEVPTCETDNFLAP
jgi:anti-sigma-K factor RskA